MYINVLVSIYENGLDSAGSSPFMFLISRFYNNCRG